MRSLFSTGRRIGGLVAIAALVSGAFVTVAQAAPAPVVFGTAGAAPKSQTASCPTTVTLSTTVKVKAPMALKYQWTFSDGDKSTVKTYRVGGKGVKSLRLSTKVKVAGDARGWGAVRVLSPVKKVSKKAAFVVSCTGAGGSGGDVWDGAGSTVEPVASGETTSTPTPAPTSTTPPPGEEDGVNLVKKVAIAFERTDAAKCPVNFRIHGFFEGLPAGAQTVRYRFVGGSWKTVEIPAERGEVYRTVLETFEWTREMGHTSVRIELDQPNRLRSNIIYYFKCNQLPSETVVGVAAETAELTATGGPAAEVVADAFLEAVQPITGADAALVSRAALNWKIEKGQVTSSELWGVLPRGIAVDVRAATGAQLKKLLVPNDARAGVLTPSAGLRYTLDNGVITELTLNGVAVGDAQVVKIAGNYLTFGGWDGFPQWQNTVAVAHSGPDDMAALGSYLANHSPIQAPKGDRVTLR